MLKSEWLKEAESWEQKAQIALDAGDEIWAETCQHKARGCRTAADYAPDDDQEVDGGTK